MLTAEITVYAATVHMAPLKECTMAPEAPAENLVTVLQPMIRSNTKGGPDDGETEWVMSKLDSQDVRRQSDARY